MKDPRLTELALRITRISQALEVNSRRMVATQALNRESSIELAAIANELTTINHEEAP